MKKLIIHNSPGSTEKIWNDFHENLFAFILSKVKDKSLAKDLLQDVFVKIHLNIDSLRSDSKLSSWVYRITRNTILDHFRKQKPQIEIQDDVFSVEDAEDSEGEIWKCLSPFIEKLETKYREAIKATDLGNLSQKEYAEKYNISYSGAKSRVQRGREKLRELFKSCCNPVTDRYGNLIEKSACKQDCGCE